jgi:hypothetical protein
VPYCEGEPDPDRQPLPERAGRELHPQQARHAFPGEPRARTAAVAMAETTGCPAAQALHTLHASP